MKTLIKKDLQQLRVQAHHLCPVVLMGAKGLSEALYKEIDRALTSHGLTKVQLTEKLDAELIQALCMRFNAHWVQSVGKTLVLYRELPTTDADTASKATERIKSKKPKRFARSAPAPITQISNKKFSTNRPPSLVSNLRLSAGGLIKKRKTKKTSMKKRLSG